jgi:hypothetical protein
MKELEKQWQSVIDFFKQKFTGGEEPQMDTILFLIGVQEYGHIKSNFSKDEKLNLMHIATCKLLEPFGYYKFSHIDNEGWPHYSTVKPIERDVNQEELIRRAIIHYFFLKKIL